MRILVVEDDKKIASFIVNGLKQSGYAVDHSADGEEGLFHAQTVAYDAAVIDVMLTSMTSRSDNCTLQTTAPRHVPVADPLAERDWDHGAILMIALSRCG